MLSLITVMYIGTRCSLHKINIYEEKIRPIPRYFAYDTSAEPERIKKSVQKENLGQLLMQSQQVKPVRERLERDLNWLHQIGKCSFHWWLVDQF